MLSKFQMLNFITIKKLYLLGAKLGLKLVVKKEFVKMNNIPGRL